MFHPFVSAMTLAVLTLGAALVGQDNCPRERAQRVEARHDVGPIVSCSTGAILNIGGVQIGNQPNTCPLFVVLFPQHDRAEASTLRTRVQNTGNAPVSVAWFQCERRWFLFIPVDTVCAHQRTDTLYTLPLLTTVPCDPLAPDAVSGE